MPVFHAYGWGLLGAGALITTVTALVGLVLMLYGYKMSVYATVGALSACMTNPPGLAAAQNQTRAEAPTLAYASVYPVALIFKIVLAQFLVQILARVMGVGQ